MPAQSLKNYLECANIYKGTSRKKKFMGALLIN